LLLVSTQQKFNNPPLFGSRDHTLTRRPQAATTLSWQLLRTDTSTIEKGTQRPQMHRISRRWTRPVGCSIRGESPLLEHVDDAVEMPSVSNPNESRWRHVATRSRLSLPRLPVGIGPRRSVERHDGRPAAGRPQADEAEPPDQGSQRLMLHPTSLPPCPHCRRLTGVEEDDTTGSSLRWFVCRFCGRRWSVAPRKAR